MAQEPQTELTWEQLQQHVAEARNASAPQQANADEPAELSTANQPPGTTRVENGVAYDISGKPLGQANEGPAAPQVDYLALAKQMGGTPAPPQVDYLALAKRMGGTPSVPATKTAPQQSQDLLTRALAGSARMAQGGTASTENAELAQAKNASDYIYNNILRKNDYQHNNLSYDEHPTTAAGKLWQRLWGWATQEEINEIPGLEPDRVTMLRESGNDLLSRILGGQNAKDLRHFIEGGFSIPAGPYGTVSGKVLEPIAEPEVYARALAKSTTDFFSPGYYALGLFGRVAQGYQKAAQVAANAGNMADAARAMSKARLLSILGTGVNVPFAASQAHDLVENWDRMNVPERVAAMAGILGASINAHIGVKHLGGYSQVAQDTLAGTKALGQDIAQSKAAQATRQAVGSMVTLGKAQTFDEAIQRGSSLTSKKFRQQQANIRNASPELQAVALANPNAETPGQFAQGIRNWLQEREQVLLQASGGTKNSDVPVSPNLENDVRERLDRFFDDNRGKYGNDEQVEAAKQKIMERLLLQSKDPNAPPALRMPNAFETENIRQGLNQEIKPQLGGEPTSNAYRAAVQQTLPILREALDSFYHDKGVKNVKEFRSKEATMIDVADRLEAAEKRAQEMGNPSIWGTLARRFSVPTIITSIALGHNPLAFGALAPYLISERAYHNYKNPGVNIRRAIDLAEPKPITDIQQVPRSPMQGPSAGAPGSVPPGVTPPIHPTKAGQAAAAVAAATMPEPATNHPLNAQLATHFGEPLDHASLDDRIERVKNDAEAMRRSGVDLAKTNTGKMLGMINEHESEHAAKIEAEQQKAHEDAAKVAQELHDEFQKAQEENRKKITEGGQQPKKAAFVLPYETTDEELPTSKVGGKMYTPFNVRMHELGHQVWSHLMGLQPFDVLSQSHPDAEGAHAVARSDISRLLNPDGTNNKEAFKANLGDLVSRFLAGAVAEDIHGGVPMEQNTSAKSDVNMVTKILDSLDVPETDRKRIIQQAVAQLRETFSRPDVAEVMNAFASKRKAGLSPDYHFDETQIHQLRQALDNLTKGGPYGTDETSPGVNKGARGENVGVGEKPVARGERGGAPEPGRLQQAAAGLDERTTGDEDLDAAIRNGGGIPAGFMNVPGHGDYRMFHDPETGSTLAFKPHEAITPQTVGKKLAVSREEFEAGKRREAARDLQIQQAKKSKQPKKEEKALESGWILSNGKHEPLMESETHAGAWGRLGGEDSTERAGLDAGAIRVHVRDYVPGKPTEISFAAKEDTLDNRRKIGDALLRAPEGTKTVTTHFEDEDAFKEQSFKDALKDFPISSRAEFEEGQRREAARQNQPKKVAEVSTEEEPEMERLRRLGTSTRTPEAVAAEAAEQAKTAYQAKKPEQQLMQPKKDDLSNRLVETFGTTKDPLDAGFILHDGRMVPLHDTHNTMMETLYNKYGDIGINEAERTHFINAEQAVRTRYRTTKGGPEVVFSVPKQGVTPEQIEQIKKSVGSLRNGNVVMEISEGEGKSAKKEFARVSDVEPMLKEIGALPESIKLQPKKNAPKEIKLDDEWQSFGPKIKKLTARDAQGEEVGHITIETPNKSKAFIAQSMVDESHRGKGIGEALYRAAIEKARESGVKIFQSDTKDRGVSEDAQRVWQKLKNSGDYAVNQDKNGRWTIDLQPKKNAPAPAVAEGADEYNEKAGRPAIDATVKPHSPEFAKRVADAFDAMKHEPDNPAVKKSYQAMANEVKKQWDYATKEMGMKFEPWTKEGQPYANSKEMVDDVRDNKHLYFFTGGDISADNPLNRVDPETGHTGMEMFRAVHDLFGHAAHGFEFGPKGEENAYLVHRQMFPAEAIPALTSETRGQNSWVNFGKHLRNEAGEVPKKGEAGYVPPTERPYAEQKVGLLPEEFHGTKAKALEGLNASRMEKTASPEHQKLVDDAKWEDNPTTGYRKLVVRDDSGKEVGRISHDNYRIRLSSINDDYAGQGIGKAMYEKAFEDAKQHGTTELMSDTSLSRDANNVWQSLIRGGKYDITAEPSKEVNRGKVGKAFDDLHTQYTVHLNQRPEKDWTKDVTEKPFGGVNPNNPEAPSKKYGFEILPEQRHNPDALTAEEARAYANRPEVKAALAAHPDLKLGWDTTTKGPELNIGASTDNLDTAKKIAGKLDQRAIVNTQTGEEIPAGGKGEKTSFPEYPLEDRLKDLDAGRMEKSAPAKEYDENPEDFKHISPQVLQYLEPDEQSFIKGNKRSQQLIQEAYDGIKPTMDETKAAIQAGQALGGWWRRYIDVFNALGEHTNQELASKLGPKHADALKIWHAAVSGNKSVELANKIAWGSYADWLDKGKPRDRASIDRILADNGAVTDTHFPKSSKKAGQVKTEGLDTTKLFRLVNSPQMREINPSPFHGDVFDPNNPSPIYGTTSGARKIPSMGATVVGEGNLNRLVLDTHMKDYFGENKWTDNKYLAFSAHLRQAARELGLQPGEGQEQLWGTVLGIKKLLYEGLPDSEIPDELTNDLIEGIGKDYAQIIKDDPELSDIFERLKAHGIDPGGNRAQERLAAILEGKRTSQKAPVDQARLAESAARIRKNLKDVPEPTNELSFKFGANALKMNKDAPESPADRVPDILSESKYKAFIDTDGSIVGHGQEHEDTLEGTRYAPPEPQTENEADWEEYHEQQQHATDKAVRDGLVRVAGLGMPNSPLYVQISKPLTDGQKAAIGKAIREQGSVIWDIAPKGMLTNNRKTIKSGEGVTSGDFFRAADAVFKKK